MTDTKSHRLLLPPGGWHRTVQLKKQKRAQTHMQLTRRKQWWQTMFSAVAYMLTYFSAFQCFCEKLCVCCFAGLVRRKLDLSDSTTCCSLLNAIFVSFLYVKTTYCAFILPFLWLNEAIKTKFQLSIYCSTEFSSHWLECQQNKHCETQTQWLLHFPLIKRSCMKVFLF